MWFNPRPPRFFRVQGEHHEDREGFGRASSSLGLDCLVACPARFASHGIRRHRPDYLRRSAGIGMAELELGGGRSRQHGECQYGRRLDSRNAGTIFGALSTFRRSAGRHQWLSESHLLCPRRNHRRADLPGAGHHWRRSPARCARECARGRHVAEDHGAAELARRREPHRREWLLVPGNRGRRFAHLLYRHRRAGVRRSAHAATAGQRHGHLPGSAGQRLEQLELGQRQHRQHGQCAHGLERHRRDGRCLRGVVSAARGHAHRRVREPEVLDSWRRHRRTDSECRRAAQ